MESEKLLARRKPKSTLLDEESLGKHRDEAGPRARTSGPAHPGSSASNDNVGDTDKQRDARQLTPSKSKKKFCSELHEMDPFCLRQQYPPPVESFHWLV
jgi:hypothetical protein